MWSEVSSQVTGESWSQLVGPCALPRRRVRVVREPVTSDARRRVRIDVDCVITE